MNIELTIFLLRLVAGLSLTGFLLALFVVIWRSASAVQQPLPAGSVPGYLVCEQPALDPTERRCALRPIVTLGRAEGNTVVINDDFARASGGSRTGKAATAPSSTARRFFAAQSSPTATKSASGCIAFGST